MTTIRPIVFKQDMPAVLALEEAIFAEDAFPIFEFIYLHNKGKETFLVAVQDGKLTGYISAFVENNVAYIASIAVDTKFRRQGIGRKLIQQVIDIVPKTATSIELHVRQSNFAAIKLYQSLGFTLSFIELEYYPDEDAHVMRLDLPKPD